ncbi:hypothetical protein BDZ90DRAFT_233573 [Jaminaea rosea]|uniref:FIST domain-containing protein n=1 Tax=Jaminaea rosea TaxID=1569628 RepID=A0A316UM00_9BASI|nr:hypothetical protein BDZ90DRAFT_233573 [Jaminaea rosea]PWN25974.1 hypothetical protein BDZ90DRAFT_233573 [Jaminaea rosea]
MPHVGVLCDPLPEAWLPPAALGEAASSSSSSASSSQSPLLHLVSLSLLPSTLVTPFASTIPGSAPIKAGRWATGKAAFDDSHSRVDALAETEGKDWRDLWGRENAANALPTVLEGMKAEDVLATLVVGSDDAPQGLLEGLDARHASGGAPLVGSLASNIFFETGGRDRCMFYRASSKTEAELRDKGAVGLVFASQSQAAAEASSGSRSGSSKPSLETKTPWQRLEALPQGRDSTAKPTLRRITRAKGNIVSLLAEQDDFSPPEGRNACQAFLRDVAEGRKSSITASSEAAATASKNNMTPEEQRNLSSRVGKEEQFWAAVYRSPRDAEEKTPRPVLVSRILSGHPGRGTLSLETDLDLSEGGAMEDPIAGLGTKRGELWIQFFKQVGDERGQHHVIDVPGSDLGAWALPRFLFVAALATEAAAPTSAAASAPEAGAKQQKARVHALPNVFLLPSSGAPSSTAGGSDAEDGGGGSILKREGGGNSAGTMVKGEEGKLSSDVERRTSMWRLPGTSVLLDLRGEAGSGAGDGKKSS